MSDAPGSGRRPGGSPPPPGASPDFNVVGGGGILRADNARLQRERDEAKSSDEAKTKKIAELEAQLAAVTAEKDEKVKQYDDATKLIEQNHDIANKYDASEKQNNELKEQIKSSVDTAKS